MEEIEVEMQYYKNDLKRLKKVDFNPDLVHQLSKSHGASVEIKDKVSSGFPQVIIKLSHHNEGQLKEVVKQIVAAYGTPELSSPMFGGGKKKRGNELVKTAMREIAL